MRQRHARIRCNAGRGAGLVAVAVAVGAGMLLSNLIVATPGEAASVTRDDAAFVAVPPGAVAEGILPSAQQLSGEVALSPGDPAALDAFVVAVSTPGSPSYRHFLRPGQFGPRFGATSDTVHAVRSWLTGSGLRVTGVDPDGLFVHFAGSVASVSSALGLAIERYRLGGVHGFAASGIPLVPADVVAQVRGIVGLSSLDLPRPRLESGTGPPSSGSTSPAGSPSAAVPHFQSAPSACSSAVNEAAANHGYTDTQVASAYGFDNLYNQGLLGAGVTVAVYELEPYSSTDVSTFENCYGITTAVTPVLVNGGAGSGAGQGEAALDIEQVAALAPQASILVYEGPGATQGDVSNVYQQIANDDRAQVVSTSWGLCEQGLGSQWIGNQYALFQQMAAQGQSVLAAAGDTGAEDCYGITNNGANPAVDDPASQPDVTGVGATSLTSLSPLVESVWNDCRAQPATCASSAGTGATGGGVSAAWPMPSWQQGPGVVNANSSGLPCNNSPGLCREVPDVAATGDPGHGVPIYWNGAWIDVGGTSAAVVVWAALAALLDQQLSPGQRLGLLSPTLYKAASCPSTFHDITAGDNDFDANSDGLYPAGGGYDMASGWGSPDAVGLSAALTDGCIANSHVGGGPGGTGAGGAGGPSQFAQSSSFVVLQPDGSPSLFVRGAGGSLLNYWYVNGVWDSAQVASGGLSSEPVAVLQPDGSPSVFFAGPGGSLDNDWYANGTWYSAQIAPSGVASTPVVMLQGDGAPTVFVRTDGNALLNYFYVASTGQWGAGTVVGGNSAFSAPAAMDQLDGAPTVVVEGPGNSVLNFWYIPANGVWGSGTVAGPGSAYSDPGALPQTDGSPSVVVQGPGNAVLNFWYIASQGVWGAGTVAGHGSAYSAPGVILQLDGASPSLLVEGPGNSMLNFWYIASQGIWGSGTVAGQGSAYSAPGVIAQPDGGPSVFVIGPGGSLFNYWYIAGQGTWGAAEVAAGGVS